MEAKLVQGPVWAIRATPTKEGRDHSEARGTTVHCLGEFTRMDPPRTHEHENMRTPRLQCLPPDSESPRAPLSTPLRTPTFPPHPKQTNKQRNKKKGTAANLAAPRRGGGARPRSQASLPPSLLRSAPRSPLPPPLPPFPLPARCLSSEGVLHLRNEEKIPLSLSLTWTAPAMRGGGRGQATLKRAGDQPTHMSHTQRTEKTA